MSDIAPAVFKLAIEDSFGHAPVIHTYDVARPAELRAKYESLDSIYQTARQDLRVGRSVLAIYTSDLTETAHMKLIERFDLALVC